MAAGDEVEAFAFPDAQDEVNTYPIAPLAQSTKPGLAHEFVDLVLGDTGQQVLHDAGFGKP